MAEDNPAACFGRLALAASTVPAAAGTLMATRRSDVSGVCVLNTGEASPLPSSRGAFRSTGAPPFKG